MKIDRKSDAWNSAPWHVKVSAYGSKTVTGVRMWKNLSFFIGLAGFLIGAINSELTVIPDAYYHIPFYVASLGLAACMYWFALDWFRDNPDALTSN